MNGTFNRNVVQKTDCDLKHAMERYEEICLRIIASTVCHLKCIITYEFRLYPSISRFLKQISLYLSIECFNSQSVFCDTFLLKVPFIPWLYIIFSIIIRCTKVKIQRF